MPPYKRRYKKKTRYSRSTRYMSQGHSALALAGQALTVAYGVKKLMNVEFKFHDVQFTSANISTSAKITELTNIPQGDTDQSRDGAQVKLTKINIRYMITAHASDPTTLVRVMLVHDRQTNQAIYEILDLLQDTSANDSICSLLNLDNKYRFAILYNKVHTFSDNWKEASFHEINKTLNLKIRYDNSTPDITDLTSSSLSLVMISTSASTNFPVATVFARLRYVDN